MNKKPPEARRTYPVKVSFTAEEYATLQALAKAAGRKPATYCRLKALDQASAIVYTTPEAKELRGDLGRIGNNLNQIAYQLNVGHVLGRVDYRDLKQLLTRLQDTLIRLREDLSR